MHRTQTRSSMIAAALYAGFMTAVTPVPAGEEFLSPSEAGRILTDGKPWAAVTSDGKRAKLTLNRDGTGSFEGPITLSVNWTMKGPDICLHLLIAGTKCVRFQRIANGYAGYVGTKLDLTLTR